MSEHEHEYKLDVQGSFYYCESCGDDLTIQDLLKKYIENYARIKALEGVVEALTPYYQKDIENFGLELASLYPLATNLPIQVLQALKKLGEV